MWSSTYKSSEKKDGFTRVENNGVGGILCKMAAKQASWQKTTTMPWTTTSKGLWMGWQGGVGAGGHGDGRGMYGIK
jgi:hypothetical protein